MSKRLKARNKRLTWLLEESISQLYRVRKRLKHSRMKDAKMLIKEIEELMQEACGV